MENKKFLGKIGDYKIPTLTKEELIQVWKIAEGLQQVDGFNNPSQILSILEQYNIEGKLEFNDVVSYLKKLYTGNGKFDFKQMEYDLVSTRIAEVLSDDSFTMGPNVLKNIHKYLFEDIYDFAGCYRNKNIISNETILDGNHVSFTPSYELQATIDYEFSEEMNFSYKNITNKEAIKHLARFTSNIWQIHPFMEGNTRTVAVFIKKYLKKLGFETSNDIFKDNSLYFRNALVRSQYSNRVDGVYPDYKPLEYFFENLLLDFNHELNNEGLIPDVYKKRVLSK